MTSQEQKNQDFKKVVEPVLKWLAENNHPHVLIIITPTNAQLLEGVLSTSEILHHLKD